MGSPPPSYHSFDLQAWQKRSIPATILLKFSELMLQSSLYTANKKSKLIGRLSKFINPFTPPCDDQVSDEDDFFYFTNTRHVIAGKLSAKPNGRLRCHIWIQYGPCITILTFLIYVHSMFHLHPLQDHFISC